MTSYLMEVKQCQSTVVLLYASEQDAANIYNESQRLNLTRDGYAWIVTEQGITGEALSAAPDGLLGIRLDGGTNSSAHIRGAINVIATGYRSYAQSDVAAESGPPKHCRDDDPWVNGAQFYRNLIEAKVGNIQFDNSGDMIAASYTVLNVNKNQLLPVGTWRAEPEPLDLETKKITWPGGTSIKPVGFEISTHFRVVSIKSHPFTYIDPTLEDGKSCLDEDAIECTDYDGTPKCCSGFCMDLLKELAKDKDLNFTYDVHLVNDDNYGVYERVNGSAKKWTGLIGELVYGQADMIVAPLTINQERSKVIDFSKPFKYQGLSILTKKVNGSTKKKWTGLMGELIEQRADMIVAPLPINHEGAKAIDFTKPFKYRGISIIIKKPNDAHNLSQIVRPFETKLWIVIFASIHLVAIILYLLDRFSPFSRPKSGHQDEPDSCNISQAVWFTWSVMFNSGVGEGTPRSFAARVLGVVWAGFAMIIVASYTANLAAYLVLDKPKGGITGINDARIRNPSSSFKYATIEKSSVETYFRRQVELSSMYRFMKNKNYKNAEDAIDALKKNKIQAFIWDSAMLEYEAARDCSLITVGELFGRSGFGIGLRLNSPWTSKMSLKILNFHENGKMEELDGNWIRRNKCTHKSTQPTTLGMSSMGGVFILVAGGLLFSCFCIWVEILYKRKQDEKKRQLDLARIAVEHWRDTVKERRRGKLSAAAEKHNGVQGPAALEKEMDGTMPVSLLNRRSRNKSAAATRWSNAGAAVIRNQNRSFFPDLELKERV